MPRKNKSGKEREAGTADTDDEISENTLRGRKCEGDECKGDDCQHLQISGKSQPGNFC
jgi:hypothetical protein